jgi:hypothetical protein
MINENIAARSERQEELSVPGPDEISPNLAMLFDSLNHVCLWTRSSGESLEGIQLIMNSMSLAFQDHG